MRIPGSVLATSLLLGALPATAQERPPGPHAPGWLGVRYEVQWHQQDDRCTPRLLVNRVVRGSPAERAGLREGDLILAMRGEPVRSTLPELSARLVAGDSIRLRLDRDGRIRELIAIADRRPRRLAVPDPPGAPELREGAAPIVVRVGDRLAARNVEAVARPGRHAHGYWFATGDGRPEYRRLRTWSGDELDRRVAALLECAQAEAVAPRRIELRELQERVDSIRLRLAERAMRTQPDPVHVRAQREGHLSIVEELTNRGEAIVGVRVGEDGARLSRVSPGALLRIEDHLTAALRGVAGAEVAALEPELAAYFRNVRHGLLVLRVSESTPAHAAGLRPGDVIVAAEGRRLTSVPELRSLLAQRPTRLELQVVRKGEGRTITLPKR